MREIEDSTSRQNQPLTLNDLRVGAPLLLKLPPSARGCNPPPLPPPPLADSESRDPPEGGCCCCDDDDDADKDGDPVCC